MAEEDPVTLDASTDIQQALFYPYTSNGLGWCFENGVMMPAWQAQVLAALDSGVASTYLNTPVALQVCTDNGITGDNAACAAYLINEFTIAILSSDLSSTTLLTICEYPIDPDWYTLVDCQCTVSCNPGFDRCGDSCFDPTSYECVSGVVSESVQITRRRRWFMCAPGLDPCSTGAPGWECLDTSSDIEACGGCPGTPEAVDCTELPGASAVTCRGGQCVVEGCSRGHNLVDNECVPRS